MTNERRQYRPVSIGGIARGLSGMLTYYGIIGILLGVFALCVVGPLAVFRLLGGDDVRQRHRADGHYQAGENTPEWLRPYVGNYSRHGQALDIAPDGQGLFRSRTYTSCAEDPPEPCEKEVGDMPIRITFTVVRHGGGVVARNAERDVRITVIKPGILEYGGDTYCDGEVIDPEDPAIEACGA